uniref:Uncharacterized protein n=1 Tax=Candidatus Kentrum eta TaxID=2126337 RepID=A0A450VL14_9GAMM|nr:MAG: hypothetical protein BECKH772B_GA0070898_102772 [Candidatus Kentron sp. H]VFK02449.1 MAG: hypothetical protein BECKH772A_GA0070896_102702 [Candidatus Kentron sp. H]VFK05441.1 MAG: hypothetical protein BECKH772C_GA0070978_102722 [Candidatus Kentron sp. H]
MEDAVSVIYHWKNILYGAIAYSVGDAIGALILAEFSIYRMAGIMLVAGTLYAMEASYCFRWIDARIPNNGKLVNAISRTALMALYFNPLWIARHLFFIYLFSGNWNQINWELVIMGMWSFMASLPIALPANYLIQNKIPYHWRFFASGIFAALLAVYYALTEVLFG